MSDAHAETLEASLESLETLVKSLETEDLPIDKRISEYEKGVALLKQTQKKIAQIELKIEKLNDSGKLEDY